MSMSTPTNELNLTEQIEMLEISPVKPAKIPQNKIAIAWERRSTKQNPVEEKDRYRGVLISDTALQLPQEACQSKFREMLQSTINKAAQDMLTSYCQQNELARSIEAVKFTLNGVLAFWAEEKQRSTIDGAQILEFLKTSKTLAAFGEGKQKVWLTKVPKMAAPTYRQLFSKEQAASIVAQINDEELEHPVVMFIVTRCETIINAPEESEEL